MSNFELIDDYLGNRLSEQDKAAFEKVASSDPSLQADLSMQRQIIEGVQNARKLELKAMLNNVPVSGSSSGTVAAGKIAATIVTAGIIGSLIYYYLPSKEAPKDVAPQTIVEERKSALPEDKKEAIAETPAVTQPAAEVPKKQVAKVTPKAGQNAASPATTAPAVAGKQPKIDVVDPSEDMENSAGASKDPKNSGTNAKATGTVSRIAVDTESANKKYNFHYQFSGSKLMLYGPFDKSLYEILEINGDKKAVFLFYKDNYYPLNDTQHTITRLEPIKDAVLVKKLKDYRDSNHQ